jgi:ribA/ribD-fused uncharacterized protein
MEEIYFYQPNDEYGWLSNFYYAPITQMILFPNGEKRLIIFKTNENYFHCHKSLNNIELFNEILNAEPIIARKLGREKADLPLLWREQLSYEVMYEALLLKFTQHPHLKNDLLKTGNCIIHENSPIDFKWGCQSSGRSLLGKYLMEIRGFLNYQKIIK